MFLNTLEKAIESTWPILTIFLVTLVCVRVSYLRNHHEKISLYKELLNLLAVLYILLLFELLTTAELNTHGGYNIAPFSEIMRYQFGSKSFIYNVCGNILIFIPFGFFISNYIKPKKWVSPFIISLLTSASVEIVQYQIGRSFDIDDIILNVVGGLLGYFVYAILKYIAKKIPKLADNDGLFNIICIIIIIVLMLYVLKTVGV